jgi:hypothetical protein
MSSSVDRASTLPGQMRSEPPQTGNHNLQAIDAQAKPPTHHLNGAMNAEEAET